MINSALWFGARTFVVFVLGVIAGPCLAETIKLEAHGGTFIINGRINGAVPVAFVLDTGASEVAIPANVVQSLSQAGELSNRDFLDARTYTLADGSRVKRRRVTLREIAVGQQRIRNVTASIGPAGSDALLGQSFLSRFASWTLDNSRKELVLGNEGSTPAAAAPGAASLGAFAYDEGSGKYGFSWKQPSPQAAADMAVKGCSASACKVVFRIGPHECGAIALTESGNVWGGAKRQHREAAELAALENCQKRTPSQCLVRGAGCNR